jgi:PqqD family protein of HPr-rel-A system
MTAEPPFQPLLLRLYRAEPADMRIHDTLDAMTVIFQRRSGITHIVAEPVPQILAAMGDDPCDGALIAARLQAQFDLGDRKTAHDIICARLEELALLGLVERIHA